MEGDSEEAAYKIKYVKWPPWAASPRNVPILLQDVNGPCPLIAIINVLLLRGTITLPMEAGEIPQARCVMLYLWFLWRLPNVVLPCCILNPSSFLSLKFSFNSYKGVYQYLQTRVIQLLAEHLLDSNFSEQTEDSANFQHNLSDAISLLPKLTTGIDINVRFDGIRRVEYTREITVFDLLGIDLVHGWLVDPQDVSTAKAIGSRSYNELVVCVIQALGANATPKVLSRRPSRAAHEQQPIVPTVDEASLAAALQAIGVKETLGSEEESHGDERLLTYEGEKPGAASDLVNTEEQQTLQKKVVQATPPSPPLHDVLLIQDFLETHSSQLTVFGLTSLQEDLANCSLAVFFRNNHFNVMLRSGTGLYLLVTDEGYRFEADVVWEYLNNVDGDTQLVGWDLCPFAPHAREESSLAQQHSMEGVNEDADYALAMQLQQEEEARARRQETNQRAQATNATNATNSMTSSRLDPRQSRPTQNESSTARLQTLVPEKKSNKKTMDCSLM
jgi:hypothetical protein